MPPPDGELSVFVTDGLSGDDEIHDLGRAHVSKPTKKCKGFAEIGVPNVTRHNLAVTRDDDPERHAIVTGWPVDKHFQKSLAQQMAADAILHYAPHKY